MNLPNPFFNPFRFWGLISSGDKLHNLILCWWRGKKNPIICLRPPDSFYGLGPGPCWENNYSILTFSLMGVILQWSSVLSWEDLVHLAVHPPHRQLPKHSSAILPRPGRHRLPCHPSAALPEYPQGLRRGDNIFLLASFPWFCGFSRNTSV